LKGPEKAAAMEDMLKAQIADPGMLLLEKQNLKFRTNRNECHLKPRREHNNTETGCELDSTGSEQGPLSPAK
jgi:hypothetical protein